MIEPSAIRDVLGPLHLGPDETKELAAAVSRPPRPAVRPRRRLDPAALPFAVEETPWYRSAYFVLDDLRPAAHVLYGAGEYYIQDAGSFLALAVLEAKPGECIADLCAAPGGKAVAILDELGQEGWLLANETIGSRVASLRFNLAKHGATRFVASRHDPGQLTEALGPIFDAVLVDAPCSGQALVGRGRQTESAFQRAAIEHCAARQARILAAAAGLVRPGGRLVYSTCTLSYAENEGQIAEFLQAHAGWAAERCGGLAAWESPIAAGCYRLWPHRHGCGAAFAALLRCGESAGEPSHARIAARSGRLRPKSLPGEFDQWGSLEQASVWGTRDCLFAWPEPPEPSWLCVAEEGPEVAFQKGRTWFPSYALALRTDPGWHPSEIASLSDREAIAYLQGSTLNCTHRGWALAAWTGHPLGWLKGDGQRAKNHLPKPARLNIRSRDVRPD